VRADNSLTAACEQLVAELEREGVRDPRVLDAIRQVPRERFVPRELREHAYRNAALPIGAGQTISQPLVVGVMTQALGLRGDERVLEVGTGSGYQAALLSRLAHEVVTIERLPELAARARQVLAELGCHNVEVHVGDGTLGWPPRAPYDAIIVTAAGPKVPPALLAQLADGGRLVIPVGPRTAQELLLVTRVGPTTHTRELGPVRFVPLVGAEGWPASVEQAPLPEEDAGG